MKLPSLPLPIFVLVSVAAACSSGSSPVGVDTTDSGAHDGSLADSATPKRDGGGGSDTGSGSGDAGCTGNEATWKSLTPTAVSCTKNSDCCVIVNGCMSESQIVSATNEQAAKAAWPTCQDQCNQCIPPAISVYCANGTCAGTLVELGTDASDGLMQDHCGVDGTSGSADTPMFFSCGSTPPGSGDGGKTDSGVANDSGKDSAAGKDSGGGDAGCTGDAATWASLTGTAVSCTKNSDCCVIVNDCTWEAQVVSAANETAAEAAWPTCQNECTHCMSPAVDVGCFNGTCGGRVVSLTSDGGLSLFGTHCGDDSVSTTGQSTGGSAFECNAKPTGSDGGA